MNYSQQKHIEQTEQLRKLLTDLPPFVHEFFRGIADSKTLTTRIAYCYDIQLFLNFLSEEITLFEKKPLGDYTLEDLVTVTPELVEIYLEHLSLYTKTYTTAKQKEYGKVNTNRAAGKARKLSAIRSLYAYFIKKEKLKVNPAVIVTTPKIKEQAIVKLEVNEVAKLLDHVEDGTNLTKHQKNYHNLTGTRDLAMLTLLLGTGIRVSECVGINLNNLDFDDNYVLVTRKGGNQATVYFGDEVREALLNYLPLRQEMNPEEGHENAFFLSIQRKRITPRAVQKLVKKYADVTLTNDKKISPHKLRSTFGTHLYRETGDIYLVATALGHKDVNTTKKHYAATDEAAKRTASQVVKLRKN